MPNDQKKPMVTRSMQPWGSDAMLDALARRWQRLVPGGENLSYEQALAAAQATLMWGANPFSGQIRAWVTEDGKFVIVPGYTLIVTWATTKSPFVRKFTKVTGHGVPKKALAFECQLMRVDTMPVFNALTAGGADYADAWATCAFTSIGVVKPQEMFDDTGRPIDTELRNWTWEDLAQKRALTKAIRQAYGYPTIAEISAMSWATTDGTVTDEEDWQAAWTSYPDGTDGERAQVASLSARTRETLQKFSELTPEEMADQLAQSNLVLHPDQDI